MALLVAQVARAEGEDEQMPSPMPTVPSPADPLPDIEARDFSVRIVKRSKSAKVYLLEDVSDAQTRLGKILLLRRESNLVMAFRVIKLYPEKKQFAAKRVRRYGDIHVLDPDESYMALEKVGDVTLPPPTAQDKADLKELEGLEGISPAAGGAAANPETAPVTGVPSTPAAPAATANSAGPETEAQPFDAELDSSTTPPPEGATDSEASTSKRASEDEEDPLAHLGVTIDEVNPLDPNKQWLTGAFGFFRNSTPQGSGAYFAGGGVRYAFTLGKMLFLRRAHAQDSIAAEAGVFYYKIINFQTTNDAYEVMPLIGTARYTINFSENFGIFFYAGIVQNNVTRSSGGTEEVKAVLNAAFPAAGGGILFRVGPNWDARVDLGIDQASLGLVLRF